MNTSNIYRNRTLNQISEADVDAEIRVAGWVENIRDHGGVSFVDLRDMYGVMQVVFRNTELFKGIRKEQCLSVCGVCVSSVAGAGGVTSLAHVVESVSEDHVDDGDEDEGDEG